MIGEDNGQKHTAALCEIKVAQKQQIIKSISRE